MMLARGGKGKSGEVPGSVGCWKVERAGGCGKIRTTLEVGSRKVPPHLEWPWSGVSIPRFWLFTACRRWDGPKAA